MATDVEEEVLVINAALRMGAIAVKADAAEASDARATTWIENFIANN